jgi:hypothetical protein
VAEPGPPPAAGRVAEPDAVPGPEAESLPVPEAVPEGESGPEAGSLSVLEAVLGYKPVLGCVSGFGLVGGAVAGPEVVSVSGRAAVAATTAAGRGAVGDPGSAAGPVGRPREPGLGLCRPRLARFAVPFHPVGGLAHVTQPPRTPREAPESGRLSTSFFHNHDNSGPGSLSPAIHMRHQPLQCQT